MDRSELSSAFLKAKRALFDKKYRFLTDVQREAAFTTEGPLLVLAGAGSGKTTVLVNRVAFLIKYGNAYFSETVPEGIGEEDVGRMEQSLSLPDEELDTVLAAFTEKPCPPWAVLAITFTNKAANEMRTRLETVIGEYAKDIWASTFHSLCARILRQEGGNLGYKPGFAIYDTKDSHDLLLKCMEEFGETTINPKTIQQEISHAKEQLTVPFKFLGIYKLYQQKLHDANALDFDDLITETVRLLRDFDEVREHWQNRFRYILVDEFQDTNYAQFELVKLLSGKYRNLMVVGDDDQSIYRFRGATIENILGFDRTYKDAKVVKLEQNFRSTSRILEAANAVIKGNIGRHDKTLWTSNPKGEKIWIKRLDNENEEAHYIAQTIEKMVNTEKRKYSDFAVLYRVNAQSYKIEKTFVNQNIPYRVLAGQKFFDRKEIRDILAYLNIINNPFDEQRLLRIINEPKRKIGKTTIDTIKQISKETGESFFAVMEDSILYPALYKNSGKLQDFTKMIREFQAEAQHIPVSELIDHIIIRTGYAGMLLADEKDGIERLNNAKMLITNAQEYEEESDCPSLSDFLESISLVADIDKYDKDADAVVLMTIHSAKGLEFPVVFIPGMEEGIFPSHQSEADNNELEEERRLAYVAITRAKARLFCLNARKRKLYGQTEISNRPSRFLESIPNDIAERNGALHTAQNERRTFTKKSTVSTEFTRPASITVSSTQTVAEILTGGDRVVHPTFGAGIILSATPMGPDTLYEIAFDTVGTKKLMASFKKLKREE